MGHHRLDPYVSRGGRHCHHAMSFAQRRSGGGDNRSVAWPKLNQAFPVPPSYLSPLGRSTGQSLVGDAEGPLYVVVAAHVLDRI
jgi:hypothetical protein